MQYIAFVHSNCTSPTTEREWEQFLQLAKESGMFEGGSELGARHPLGGNAVEVPDTTSSIEGFMQFNTDDLGRLRTLLESHPNLLHGGTIELREMPRS